MSVPYEIIACEACDYQEVSLVTAGKFVWKAGDEEFWFDRQLAICENCHAAVAMENFPEKEAFTEAQKRRAGNWRKLIGR